MRTCLTVRCDLSRFETRSITRSYYASRDKNSAVTAGEKRRYTSFLIFVAPFILSVYTRFKEFGVSLMYLVARVSPKPDLVFVRDFFFIHNVRAIVRNCTVRVIFMYFFHYRFLGIGHFTKVGIFLQQFCFMLDSTFALSLLGIETN